MDGSQNQQVSLSCKTVLLKKSEVFLSAFPGKIIFGHIIEENYPKLQYFQFFHFEFFKLYLSLVEIINNCIIEENSEIKKTDLIIKLSDEVSYFWCIEIGDIKLIQFVLEYKSIINYKLNFTLDQLNDLIYSLSVSILPCLCLKHLERDFLEYIAEQEISKILNFTRENFILLLNDFKLKQNTQIDLICQPNLADLMLYYKELIII